MRVVLGYNYSVVAKINVLNRVSNKASLLELNSDMTLDLEQCLSWSEIADSVYNLTFKPYFINHEVALSFCEEHEMQELNRLYRYKNYVTDVLSFNAIGNLGVDLEKFTDLTPDPELDSEESTLGDIIICVSQARKQASEAGHSLRAEIAMLFVHGLLHLLGYDHELSDEAKQMFDLQNKVLMAHNLLEASSANILTK